MVSTGKKLQSDDHWPSKYKVCSTDFQIEYLKAFQWLQPLPSCAKCQLFTLCWGRLLSFVFSLRLRSPTGIVNVTKITLFCKVSYSAPCSSISSSQSQKRTCCHNVSTLCKKSTTWFEQNTEERLLWEEWGKEGCSVQPWRTNQGILHNCKKVPRFAKSLTKYPIVGVEIGEAEKCSDDNGWICEKREGGLVAFMEGSNSTDRAWVKPNCCPSKPFWKYLQSIRLAGRTSWETWC